MRTQLASVAAAIILAIVAPLAPGGAVMAATQQTLTVPARTYQPGRTAASRAIPAGNYSGFHIAVDFSPWTSSATTNITIGIGVSFDNGATWTDVCSFGENTPPPWTIPAKYGGGTSSSGASDCTWGATGRPTNAQGWVEVQGAAVPLGQISVTLQ